MHLFVFVQVSLLEILVPMHLFVPCPHLDDEVVEAPPEVHGLGHRGGDRGVQVRHGQERRGA